MIRFCIEDQCANHHFGWFAVWFLKKEDIQFLKNHLEMKLSKRFMLIIDIILITVLKDELTLNI